MTTTAVKNVNTDELALAMDKVVCDLNESSLLQLTKTFNLYNDNLTSTGKRYLKKTIEKYYEEIFDDNNLSDDAKTQQLQEILKSTTASAYQQHKHGVSNAPSVIADADVSRVEDKSQPNFLREPGMLNPLTKDLKIMETIGVADQKDKLTYISLIQQIKQTKLTDYTDLAMINAVISSMSPSLNTSNCLGN